MTKQVLLDPHELWSRSAVLVRDCPIPKAAGVYAWYFRALPPGVPTEGCVRSGGATLLYVGISPRRPPMNGAPSSRQTLRTRIRYHFRGNAAGSTLRLTLGCLLEPVVGTVLRRVGSGGRYTFATMECRLSEWMDENALVTWLPTAQPWRLEEELISTTVLPLNLDQNRSHSFHATLSGLRKAARARADAMSVCPKA